MFKKLISLVCITLILTPSFSFADEVSIPMGDGIATSEKNYFIVTAYYSPLPDQKSYLT
jgi:hypothetical protein